MQLPGHCRLAVRCEVAGRASFGGYGVVQVPRFQELLNYICANGFEHHVTINQARTADVITAAFNNYLGWQTFYHR